jgi:hypothetical protein
MGLPVYELKISEKLNDDAEVSYVALVDLPAIKKDFLAFNEDTKAKVQFQVVSEDEHIISGPLMLADELIFRAPNKSIKTDHYVKFSAETIKQIAIKFAKKKYQNNVNLMHDQNQVVEGVTMFESFLVDKNRGIKSMYGFEDVADGSWFGSFYVENIEVWNSIKSGEYKGFSVEGMFDYEEPITEEEQTLKKIMKLLNEIK